MSEILLSLIGKFTIISLFIGLLALIANNFNLILSINTDVTNQLDLFKFLIISSVLIFYVMIYNLMIEKYEYIMIKLFKGPMLKYTFVKKQFQNGKYEIDGNPRKSYDKLPEYIKDEIDKLDDLIHKDKIPKLFDLILASLNSIFILLFGIYYNNKIYILFGLSAVYFVILLLTTYSDIKDTILQDYKSLFEE
ncbi:hypothetical protein HNV12_16250 [Methanococcoides sp. SA1]|nr:hypothetical protein [Methanococcoides sp. SA1]